MENSFWGNLENSLLYLGKLSELISLFVAIVGFSYLLVLITLFNGEYTLFPVFPQDVFIAAKRPYILILIYFIWYFIKNRILGDRIYYYGITKKILRHLNKIFCCIYGTIFLIFFVIFLGCTKFNHIIYILISVIIFLCIPFVLVITKKIYPLKLIELTIFIVIAISCHDAMALINNKTLYRIMTNSGIISGKILLYLSDGMFILSKNGILYIKGNTILAIQSNRELALKY